MGRRSKLTPEVHDALVNSIRLGASLKIATDHAGIGPTTFHSWMARGDREPGRFRDFRDDIQKARAQCGIDALEAIQAASAKRRQAAAWLLERRHGYRHDATFHLDFDQEPPVETTNTDTESPEQYFVRQLTNAEEAVADARSKGSYQAAINGQRMCITLREKLDAIRASAAADFAVDDAGAVAAEIHELLAIPAIAKAFEQVKH